MPYTPDVTDVTNPTDSTVKAATAAAEFRAIKLYIRDVLLGGSGLAAKMDKNNGVGTGNTVLANLAISGVGTAPTQLIGDSSTKLATTEFVMNVALSGVLPGASTGEGLTLTTDGASYLFGFTKVDHISLLNNLGF